jgi:hypothetical protein
MMSFHFFFFFLKAVSHIFWSSSCYPSLSLKKKKRRTVKLQEEQKVLLKLDHKRKCPAFQK